MTDEHYLVGALMRKEISEADFLSRFPSPIQRAGELLKLLLDAASAHDADRMENLLYLAERFRLLDESYVALLSALLGEDWHYKHEDIARYLQSLRAPASTEALYRAATSKHTYLEYDNSMALARKCIWALGDIGTADARSRLQLLARSPDPEVAALAQHRLEKLGPQP